MCNPSLDNSTSKQTHSLCNLPGIKTVQKPSVCLFCLSEMKPQMQDGGCHNALHGQGYHASHGASRAKYGSTVERRLSRENRRCSKKKLQQCHYVQCESSHMTSVGCEPEALIHKPNVRRSELYQSGSTNCQN
jgi:hypothetical protein